MRASAAGVNYEEMTKRATEMLAQQQGQAARTAGVKRPADGSAESEPEGKAPGTALLHPAHTHVPHILASDVFDLWYAHEHTAIKGILQYRRAAEMLPAQRGRAACTAKHAANHLTCEQAIAPVRGLLG